MLIDEGSIHTKLASTRFCRAIMDLARGALPKLSKRSRFRSILILITVTIQKPKQRPLEARFINRLPLSNCENTANSPDLTFVSISFGGIFTVKGR